MVLAMFSDHVLIKMRAVQGVLRFKQKYGSIRLEAACSRANHYGTPGYKVVKTILEKGLDQLQNEIMEWKILAFLNNMRNFSDCRVSYPPLFFVYLIAMDVIQAQNRLDMHVEL